MTRLGQGSWEKGSGQAGQRCPHGSDLSAPSESEAGRHWASLALPPVGHSASLSRFREEEEDKMLEAMIKKKGEAPPWRRPL